MINITEEQSIELKRLEQVADEKKAAFEKLSKDLSDGNDSGDIRSAPEYIKAKAEMDTALRELGAYKTSLGTL